MTQNQNLKKYLMSAKGEADRLPLSSVVPVTASQVENLSDEDCDEMRALLIQKAVTTLSSFAYHVEIKWYDSDGDVRTMAGEYPENMLHIKKPAL